MILINGIFQGARRLRAKWRRTRVRAPPSLPTATLQPGLGFPVACLTKQQFQARLAFRSNSASRRDTSRQEIKSPTVTYNRSIHSNWIGRIRIDLCSAMILMLPPLFRPTSTWHFRHCSTCPNTWKKKKKTL